MSTLVITPTNRKTPENQKRFLLVGREDSLHETSKRLRLSRLLAWMATSTYSNYCEYVLEFRAFLHRISLLRRAPKADNPFRQLLVDYGPLYVRDEQERFVSCRGTHARISDIQNFSAKHPWATPIDWALFLEGWDAGGQWAADSLCSYTEDTESKAASKETSECSQTTNLSSGQISEAIPASIAGVTRKVE